MNVLRKRLLRATNWLPLVLVLAMGSVAEAGGTACCSHGSHCGGAGCAGCSSCELTSDCLTSDCAVGAACGPACRRGWYAQGDALWLQRGSLPRTELARDVDGQGLASGLGTFSTASLGNFEQQAGIRTTIGYRGSCERAVEASYFGLQFWNVSALYRPDLAGGAVAAQSPYLGSSIPFVHEGFNDSIFGRSLSQLHSAEINLRVWLVNNRCGQLSALTGVRYVGFQDELELAGRDVTDAVVRTEATRALARNHLIGWQAGGEFRRDLWCGLVQVGGNGRAGLYGNAAELRLTNDYAGPQTGSALDQTRRGSQFSTVVDGSLFATLRLTRGLSLRGGYQVLYLAGIGLAEHNLSATSDTIRTSDVLSGQAPVVSSDFSRDGDLFLHGPFVGGEFRY